MTEPEIRRFCQQAEVETRAGCEAARRDDGSSEAEAPFGRVRQINQQTRKDKTYERSNQT